MVNEWMWGIMNEKKKQKAKTKQTSKQKKKTMKETIEQSHQLTFLNKTKQTQT